MIDKVDKIRIGENLRISRMSKDKTQLEVALHLGIDAKTYSKYEVGSCTIPLKHLVSVCGYLETDIGDIVNKKAVVSISFIDLIKQPQAEGGKL